MSKWIWDFDDGPAGLVVCSYDMHGKGSFDLDPSIMDASAYKALAECIRTAQAVNILRSDLVKISQYQRDHEFTVDGQSLLGMLDQAAGR
jgi:hypothetical protein